MAKSAPAPSAEGAALAAIENKGFTANAAWISKELTERQGQRFYGRMILCMEGGLCVRIVEEKSIKPPSSD